VWRTDIGQTEAEGLIRPLVRETNLTAAEVSTVIARRDDQDDVAYLLADGRVVEVHLTWVPRPFELTPFITYPDLEAWRGAHADPSSL